MVKQLIGMGVKENKKVRNAQRLIYDNIQFRSQLEVHCYKRLIQAGLNPQYEPKVFELFKKFQLTNIDYYCPYNFHKSKIFDRYPRIIMGITYTPDFYVFYNGVHIYFDTKGHPNDVYPLKKKMFLKQLETIALENDEKFIFFEPHNIGQIQQSINIILEL